MNPLRKDMPFSDTYQTPKGPAIECLVPYIPEHVSKIWEPASGDGNIADTLCDRYGVRATDIRYGVDFFTSKPGPKEDAIITNPPYSVKDAWIERCFELGLPFALLLPLEAISGVRRTGSWKKGVGLLIPNRRIAFELQGGYGKKNAPPATTAWFCHKFKVLHGTFEFVEV